MVNFCIFFSCIFIFTSCNSVLIPPKYYNNYTNIIERKKHAESFDGKSIYMTEDTFLTRDYSVSLKRQVISSKYFFFYENNLMATITIPVIHNNKGFIFTQSELEDSIKTGYFDNPINSSNINWEYYSLDSNKIIRYRLTYSSSSGINLLTKGKIIESNYIILPQGLISKYNYEHSETLDYNLYKQVKLKLKPDSSKSDFLTGYKKYITTGSRIYSNSK